MNTPQIERLAALLKKHFPEIEVVAVCDNIPEAIEQVNALEPEPIFLDIELPPYNGFDLLEQSDVSMQKVGIPVVGGLEFITVSEIIMCKSTNNC